MSAFDDIQKAKDLITTNRLEARRILTDVVKSDKGNSEAWYMLSFVSDNREQAIYCLQQALKADPHNPQISNRLNVFQTRDSGPASMPVSQPVKPSHQVAVAENSSKPATSVIVVLSLLVLFWLGISLLQFGMAAFPGTVNTSDMLCFGSWNLIMSAINGYLLFQVFHKKKEALRALYILAVVGSALGIFQLIFTGALAQVCSIPLSIGLGFMAYIEKDKFINK